MRPGELANPPWDEIEAFAPTDCLHCAWIATPGEYMTSPQNADFAAWSLTLAQGLADRGLDYFLGVGSCAELLWPNDPPAYVQGKRDFQYALFAIDGLKSGWVRVFYPFGPDEPDGKFLCHAVDTLADGGRLSVQTPQAKKDYAHVRDVGMGIAFGLEKRLNGIFEVGRGETTTVRKLVEIIQAHFGRGSVDWGDQADSVPVPAADISRLHEAGWRPTISLADGIADVCNTRHP